MKINTTTSPIVDSIEIGNAFYFRPHLYIRIHGSNVNFSGGHDGLIPCVDLCDGRVMFFTPGTPVNRVKEATFEI
jgi:hypothetical protein